MFSKHLIPLVTIALVTATSSASANGLVRYVSTTGNNANNCLLATPCRILQRGLNLTPAGGELRILDSGNYGVAATVAKSVTIAGNDPNVTLSQIQLAVNAATGNVTLRNLQLAGGGATVNAVLASTVNRLNIENVIIQGYTNQAVAVTQVTEGVHFSDATIRSNGGDGFLIQNNPGAIVTIERSRFIGNSYGIWLNGTVAATISNTEASGNQNSGVVVANNSLATLTNVTVLGNTNGIRVQTGGNATLVSSVVRDQSTFGVVALAGSTVRLSHSTIVGNGQGGININGAATALSQGNNTIEGNAIADVTGTLTTYMSK